MVDSKPKYVVHPNRPEDEGRGPWITTFSGLHYHYATPTEEDIQIFDIAVALSREGRFAGHCTEYYSVAQHSVHVSELIEREYREKILRRSPNIPLSHIQPEDIRELNSKYLDRPGCSVDKALALVGLAGLLHDASEAYMKDIPSPLKRMLPDYQDMEGKCQKLIFSKYAQGVVWDDGPLRDLISHVDKRLLITEAQSLIRHKEDWRNRDWQPYEMHVYAWSPDKACVNFMARFFELTRRARAA